MQYNQFEIDSAWSEVAVTSRYGDVAHYKINRLTKQVMVKTKMGDGNANDWRHCNVSYDAVKSQPHKVIRTEDGNLVAEPPVEFVAPVVPALPAKNGHKQAKPVDLESVAPFKPRKGAEL